MIYRTRRVLVVAAGRELLDFGESTSAAAAGTFFEAARVLRVERVAVAAADALALFLGTTSSSAFSLLSPDISLEVRLVPRFAGAGFGSG